MLDYSVKLVCFALWNRNIKNEVWESLLDRGSNTKDSRSSVYLIVFLPFPKFKFVQTSICVSNQGTKLLGDINMPSTITEHCKFSSQDLTGKIATIFKCHFIWFKSIQELSACNSLKTGLYAFAGY